MVCRWSSRDTGSFLFSWAAISFERRVRISRS